MGGHASGPGNPEATSGNANSWIAELALEAARELMSPDGTPLDGALVIVTFLVQGDVDALVREAVEVVESQGVAVLSLAWPGAAKRRITEVLRARRKIGWNVLAVDTDSEAATALANEIQDWIDGEDGTEGPRIVRPR